MEEEDENVDVVNWKIKIQDNPWIQITILETTGARRSSRRKISK
jgi:hypothetical protein